MRKIFFIFAMLLMSVVSVWAEESCDEFTLDSTTLPLNIETNHFTVSGTDFYRKSRTISWKINGDNKITISANNGEIITKVVYLIAAGSEYENDMRVTNGDIDDSTCSINDINATSLEISSENVSEVFSIRSLEIYYTENNNPAEEEEEDEYLQKEIFATTAGNEYTGTNINVTGIQGNNGLYIDGTNGITISSNGNSSVQISRVDLTFSSDVNGASLTSNAGGAIVGSGTSWSIKNINSSSTTILLSSGSGYVNNIKVYYVEVPEESGDKIVSFVTESGLNYSKDNINVTGTNGNSFGLIIDNGNSVTIASDNGSEILKVDLHFSYYLPNTNKKIESTAGNVSGSAYEWSVNNVNSTSLTITHPGDGYSYEVRIDTIKVHYRERLAPSTIEVAAANLEGAYWTTFYSGIANYQAPEGTHVYKVGLNGSKITMTEIEDRIVNMGQGVVLKNLTEGNLSMTKVGNESSGDYSDNNLVGTSTTISNPDPGNVYVLNYKNTKGLAFYKLKSTGTIAANKAYLLVPSGSSVSAQEFFAFDATVTGVDNINAQDSEEEKVYDLQGRRVAKPANGLYIVNGKKVIMK